MFLMTLAMVNVLPEPVTPSSVWCFAPDEQAFRQLRDGLRLISGGLVGRNEFEHKPNLRASRERVNVGLAFSLGVKLS